MPRKHEIKPLPRTLAPKDSPPTCLYRLILPATATYLGSPGGGSCLAQKKATSAPQHEQTVNKNNTFRSATSSKITRTLQLSHRTRGRPTPRGEGGAVHGLALDHPGSARKCSVSRELSHRIAGGPRPGLGHIWSTWRSSVKAARHHLATACRGSKSKLPIRRITMKNTALAYHKRYH